MTPRGPVAITDEQVLAAFTAHRPVEADTNFFEAGFSSATLVEVLGTLRGFGVEVSLIDLYRYSTVRKVAEALRDRVDGAGREVPAAAGRTTPPWARSDAGPGR